MIPEHGRVITTIPQSDGSDLVSTSSYYDGHESSFRQEIEMSVMTDKQHVLRDIIDALNVITSNETKKLAITLNVDKHDRYRLVKRWTTSVIDYGRK